MKKASHIDGSTWLNTLPLSNGVAQLRLSSFLLLLLLMLHLLTHTRYLTTTTPFTFTNLFFFFSSLDCVWMCSVRVRHCQLSSQGGEQETQRGGTRRLEQKRWKSKFGIGRLDWKPSYAGRHAWKHPGDRMGLDAHCRLCSNHPLKKKKKSWRKIRVYSTRLFTLILPSLFHLV